MGNESAVPGSRAANVSFMINKLLRVGRADISFPGVTFGVMVTFWRYDAMASRFQKPAHPGRGLLRGQLRSALLEESPFGQRHADAIAHDDVVQQAGCPPARAPP